MAIACQRCNKVQATVHLTDLLEGQKRERHLCSDCAEQEGIVMKSHHVPLNELLSKFVMQKAVVQELADLTCEQCGTSFLEFRGQGLLGCPNDYDVFKRALEPLIERTHEGHLQHVGKIPSRTSALVQTKMAMIRLRRELDHAVEHERYEEAAHLRDEIAKLESS